MRAVVVYESMFGNTRRVAEGIVHALADSMETRLLRADLVVADDLRGIDLLVVGAPTHAWSMPRPNTRKGALNNVRRPGSDLSLEPHADSLPGVREWLDTLEEVHALAAVFDTRFSAPVVFTGRAAKGISSALQQRGLVMVSASESFRVDRQNHLLPGEVERASTWGRRLGEEVVARLKVTP